MTAISATNPSQGPPPFLMYSDMNCDADGNIYIDGGQIASVNVSMDGPTSAPVMNKSWVHFHNSSSWSTRSVNLPEFRDTPRHSLSAHAPEHDLVFHLNGFLSNDSVEQVYPNMIVTNTRTHESRVVSTASLSQNGARVGAVFRYLPLVGEKGALILFGGATKYNNNITTEWGTMVRLHDPGQWLQSFDTNFQESLDIIHVFDVASLDTTPDGIWHHQYTTVRVPQPRLLTCATQILSPDGTNYHMYVH
jgi:hypothetical protein